MSSSARRIHLQREPSSTLADLRAQPDDGRIELVEGSLERRASPSYAHGDAQGALVQWLRGGFHKRGGGPGGLGGWWIVSEVEVQFDGGNVYLPDLTGWRRERVPERPTARPMTIRPDWVCEILSPSNRNTDLVAKQRTYHRSGVPHSWVVDPEAQLLTVQRWTPEGYLIVLTAQRGETIRAEPFEALEWPVGVLFGDEPDDEAVR
ncbi:MAG: Uma2 family endonuclease [Deltaproteobacteria bacterium]|nr:Uma2 family endonuclease [Deltaproteobacteria bacterium]